MGLKQDRPTKETRSTGNPHMDARDKGLCRDASIDDLSTQELGGLGESLACFYLEERGYEILHRNYRCPEGEADIVAFDEREDSVVLIEVKTRRQLRRGELYPEEAVNKKKRRRYRRIAAHYALENYPVRAIRFDVIAINIHEGRTAGIQHILGAFDWDAER